MATSVKGKSSAQIGRKVRMTKDKVKKIIRRPSEKRCGMPIGIK